MRASSAEPSPVLVSQASGGRVQVITMNRPEVRNAVDLPMAKGIAAALDALDEDPDLAVAVLTGAGVAFCAGMDLHAFVDSGEPNAGDRGFAGIVRRPPAKPLIAAVEGYAVAGGLEIALACDLIVASEDARFGIPEVQRSLVATGGGLLRLSRRIPYHVAMELALTGDHVDARRLHRVGLVNRLAPPGTALDSAVELAGRIARNGPLAVSASKRIIEGAGDWPADERWERQEAISAPVERSDDAREGAVAFLEKRDPVWRGR